MKTIQTTTHLLLVDETAEIKEGDWFYNTISIQQSQRDNGIRHPKSVKIIAASPKLGDLPEFESLPPNTEDDVEKLADNYVKNETDKTIQLISKYSYKDGYNQSKRETMFSLEDMKDAFKNGGRYVAKLCSTTGILGLRLESLNMEDYIQSLTKPKEYEFVVEMKDICLKNCVIPCKNDCIKQPKIVNNKIQGKWKQKN